MSRSFSGATRVTLTHPSSVWSMAWAAAQSPESGSAIATDGSEIATASHDHTTCVWKLA